MAQNKYSVNGGLAHPFDESVDINMSTETGVMAGCRQYPVPLLNRITVTSTEGGLSEDRSIYAGYKVVNQLLGSIVGSGSSYNTGTPYLNTIISNGRFGMFEPAHYNTTINGRTSWNNHNMRPEQIDSLINVGTGVKICVKIEYTKSDGSPAGVYVPIDGASANFSECPNKDVPLYTEIGSFISNSPETVESQYIDGVECRSWFESVLTPDILNVSLSNYIFYPNTSQNITITLMAYIGSLPTANNTFKILPMSSGSTTSITCQFQTYDPLITIANKDASCNRDEYDDGYGSVAEYDEGTDDDTKISVTVVAQ